MSAALDALARVGHADESPPTSHALAAVLDAVAPGVPEARWASISWRRRPGERLRTVAATDEPAQQADAIQYATEEGPCLEASAGAPVVAASAELARRWPRFAPQAMARTPVRAVLSRPLPGVVNLGSVNFYGDDGTTFNEAALAGAADLAAVCSVGVATLTARARADNLEQALATSRHIGAAVGIVMAQFRCSYDQAFARIRSVSQRSHVKMRDLAEEIMFTGALPECPPS